MRTISLRSAQIQLTRQLMALFLEYQIPSDLLSFEELEDGLGVGVVVVGEIGQVKHHAASLFKLINEEKEAEVAEKKKQLEFLKGVQAVEQAQAEEEEPAEEVFYGSVGFMGGGGGGGGGKKMMKSKRMMQRGGGMERSMGLTPPPVMQQMAMSAAPEPIMKKELAVRVTTNVTVPQQQNVRQQQEKDRENDKEKDVEKDAEKENHLDITTIPDRLEEKYERLDPSGALRPAIITPSSRWTKTSQKSLTNPKSESTTCDLEKEKSEAFDLLDALTKSGAITMEAAELHVVVASSHNFCDSLIDTVINKNVNPVEKLERSCLIVASTIHGLVPAEILRGGEAGREHLLLE